MGCLKGLIITACGDVGPGKGNEQIKKWVDANGGRWVPRVTKGVTHLVASKDMYKKNAEPVKQAKEFGAFVVSYDWLEDSLQSGRKLAERKYTWEVLRDRRRNKKEMLRKGPLVDTQKFLKGCKNGQDDLGSGTSSPRRSRPSGGFFARAMDDLKRKREAREADEQAKKANTAQATKTSGAAKGHQVEQTTVTIFELAPSSTPIRPSSVEPLSPPVLPTSQPKSTPKPKPQATPHKVTRVKSAPTPSPFPPCLKYTPPSSSSAYQAPPPPSALPTPPTSATSTRNGLATSAQAASQGPKAEKLTDIYHIYLDATGFNYDLLLLRTNPFLNNFARYDLRLYESHTKPHVYCTFVRYKPPVGGGDSSAKTSTVDPSTMNEKDKAALLRAATSLPPPSYSENQSGAQQIPATENSGAAAEAARLQSLITPQSACPASNKQHSQLLAAMNSAFEPAFTAFRHAFRDITLLSWEQRRDTFHAQTNVHCLQRLRAQAFGIEPFIWKNKPIKGMPMGLEPAQGTGVQEALDQGYSPDPNTYTRNRYNLPALDAPLGREGDIGAQLHREAEAARKRQEQEQERLRKKAALEAQRSGLKTSMSKKPNWKQPLFNGATGRPTKDAYGRYYNFASPTPSTPLAPDSAGVRSRASSVASIQAGSPALSRSRSGSVATSVAGSGAGTTSRSMSGRAVFTDFSSKGQKRMSGKWFEDGS